MIPRDRIAGVAHAEEGKGGGSPTQIQLALFNPVQFFDESRSVGGFRLNLLQGANGEMTGVDLGLVNIASNVFLAVFVIFNFAFDG